MKRVYTFEDVLDFSGYHALEIQEIKDRHQAIADNPTTGNRARLWFGRNFSRG